MKLTTREQFINHKFKFLYIVHSLGGSSYMNRLKNISQLKSKELSDGYFSEYFECTYWARCLGEELKDHHFLNDCNIGNHWNEHYLFTTYREADRYLNKCLEEYLKFTM